MDIKTAATNGLIQITNAKPKCAHGGTQQIHSLQMATLITTMFFTIHTVGGLIKVKE